MTDRVRRKLSKAFPRSQGAAGLFWTRGLVCLVYFATAEAGLKLASLHGSVSPFWPASGIAVSALLVGGRRLWPGVAAGAFLANVLTPIPLAAAVGIAIGNTLEALVGAYLQKSLRKVTELQHFADMSAWLVASLAAPLFSSVVGVSSLWALGSVPSSDFLKLNFTWWMGDSIGLLVVGPVVCALGSLSRLPKLGARQILYGAILVVTALLICRLVILQPGGSSLLFLMFPVLLMATAFFGGTGVKWTCLGIVIFSVFSVGESTAPFVGDNLNSVQLRLETFLFALAVTAQYLAVLHASGCFLLPALVLLTGWTLSGWLFWDLDKERRELDKLNFEHLVEGARDSIKQRIQTYIDALRGGLGLFGASDITEQITLIQGATQRPGFALFVPMYALNERHDTVHTRRMSFQDSVFASFITADFIESALANEAYPLELSFYDGLNPSPKDLVFSTGEKTPTTFERTTVLQLAGQQFTCRWNRGSAFVGATGGPLSNAIVLSILPALLAGLVMSLQTVGRRATRLAEERTRELHRAEGEAQQARRLAEAANEAKRDFLATMSHEIRTPMNAAIVYTDLLIESPLSEKQRSWARTIERSQHALLSIINDMLDFSKIDAGKLQLESIPLSPSNCIEEVIAMMKAQATQKGLVLSSKIKNCATLRVFGDPTRFRQVLVNLVSNALRFTEKGSVMVNVAWEAATSCLHASVTDTGIGIAKDKQERLFERFSQVDSSTTRRFGGSGLGLAICKRLVELMGGQIDVRSFPGVGTSIQFKVPFKLCTTETSGELPNAGAVKHVGQAGTKAIGAGSIRPDAERMVPKGQQAPGQSGITERSSNTLNRNRNGCEPCVRADARS